MTWGDLLTCAVAGLAALECLAGRLAAMHPSEHRATWLLGYLVAFGVCLLAASAALQGVDVRWLDWAAWAIGAHLVFSWGDWRHGAPPEAQRQQRGQLVPLAVDSRQDDLR